MRRLLLTLVAPAVLLGGCAGVRTNAPDFSGEATNSPYGLFLAGNAALNAGRSAEAARLLTMAKGQGGSDPALAERAFTAALLAGDIPRAAALAPTGADASEPAKRMGRLVNVVQALAKGDGKAARAALSNDGIGFPHRPAAALISPWVAAAAGDADGSVVRPVVRGDGAVEFFGQIGQAHLYERARRFDEAETDFKAVTANDNPNDLAVLAYGGFLERRGRRADALALYDASLQRTPSNTGLRLARARAAAGRPAPKAPTIREGAAFALLVPAATLINAKQEPTGTAYLRLVLMLDPQRYDAWLMLGDQLQMKGDIEGARAAYARPKAGTPEFAAGQTKLAWSYQAAGDKETALKLARAGAATGDRDARTTLSDILRANEQYPEAVKILDELIASSPQPDWQLFYARGQAHERSGDWPLAEKDLTKALELRPDEPELLNYLGYAWIDRGERLEQALGMVERAVAANPRSGAIVDSLGWAHFRMGAYAKAVEILEQAVELQAGDPEINNHLGDAYWMVGRKDEAGFQWRRVLTLNPDDKIKADAEAKLASGLGPQPKIAGR